MPSCGRCYYVDLSRNFPFTDECILRRPTKAKQYNQLHILVFVPEELCNAKATAEQMFIRERLHEPLQRF